MMTSDDADENKDEVDLNARAVRVSSSLSSGAAYPTKYYIV